jgi:hypothetical protein
MHSSQHGVALLEPKYFAVRSEGFKKLLKDLDFSEKLWSR